MGSTCYWLVLGFILLFPMYRLLFSLWCKQVAFGEGIRGWDRMPDCLIDAGGKHPGLCRYYYRYDYGVTGWVGRRRHLYVECSEN